MSHARTVVISDLHIGAGALDDCDAELQGNLTDFLAELSIAPYDTELVIAGDFLDFAQAPPARGSDLEATGPSGLPLCFTQTQSIAKLRAILSAHAPIATALRKFLERASGNRIVIMPGNHDADFFWPLVREEFIQAVAGNEASLSARVAFFLEPVYRPAKFPGVWIEHGHQYDPLNAFFVDGIPRWSTNALPIFSDIEGTPRLLECIGTRFMIRFMNELDETYPFVDNVKPFSRFIRIFVASIFATGFGPLKAALGVLSLFHYLGKTLSTNAGDLLALDDKALHDVTIRNFIQRVLEPEQQYILAKRLRSAGFAIEQPLKMLVDDAEQGEELLIFLAEHPRLLDDLDNDASAGLLGYDECTLALVRGFKIDETKKLKEACPAILNWEGVRQVIMGHTHESVNQTPNLPYLNLGSWTRYFVFERDERTQSFKILKENNYELFPYKLQYANMIEGTNSGLANLCLFRERYKV